MKAVRLRLEFAPGARRASAADLAMLLLSLSALGTTTLLAGRTLVGIASTERSIAAIDDRAGATPSAVSRPARPDPAEAARVQLVRQTARSLITPWPELLAALESAPSNVALLSVEPSAAKRSVALTAEAANATEMLDYLQALQGDSRLSSVTLVSHQVQVQAPGTPLRFQIQAHWGGGQ